MLFDSFEQVFRKEFINFALYKHGVNKVVITLVIKLEGCLQAVDICQQPFNNPKKQIFGYKVISIINTQLLLFTFLEIKIFSSKI